ncbi:glutathione S-transferase III [Pyrenophora seminiperda CCB06]|uniref:Glutathione S-transferase III n=1 Tax=Pyrenophora seminiperda CCB06 TaxID=1302712 RepID=A0A3M7M1E5_9PLEO|nr:glutathione S-transferase III [Pyrenophora seminiperda CCB06]
MKQIQRKEARQVELKKLVARQLALAESSEHGLSDGALENFEEYRQKHEMCLAPPRKKASEGYITSKIVKKPEEQSILDENGSGKRKKVMFIDPRGNLTDHLPMLSLVNREIFNETFYLFYSQLKEGFWIKCLVRHLYFFPFLRFYQSLTTGTSPIRIPPSRLHIEFYDENDGDDTTVKKTFQHQSETKFTHVQRLVELHWLQGLPLWGCFTGLSDHPDCKGPLGDCMYSVRQVVALYRIDHATWRRHSIEYLSRYDMVWLDSVTPRDSIGDAELVEQMIHLLCTAIKYHLGYYGKGTSADPIVISDSCYPNSDGEELSSKIFRRLAKYYSVTTREREHATVHVVCQYRKKINKELRERLGEDYHEWEHYPDEVPIPKDLLL